MNQSGHGLMSIILLHCKHTRLGLCASALIDVRIRKRKVVLRVIGVTLDFLGVHVEVSTAKQGQERDGNGCFFATRDIRNNDSLTYLATETERCMVLCLGRDRCWMAKQRHGSGCT